MERKSKGYSTFKMAGSPLKNTPHTTTETHKPHPKPTFDETHDIIKEDELSKMKISEKKQKSNTYYRNKKTGVVSYSQK